ncbi:Ger(x)C family spore germination protein [Paenibacillus jiagnxiensis]|uniref:Ger(x)C family spore germination protein n=1 Tax=Paenibacillus jiagnxiensis TaxID=3228926 RepID=UPI0033A01781
MKGRLRGRILGILVVLSFLPLLSGCWERRELNQIAFVLGMGIDKTKNGYMVSMQAVIPSDIEAKGGGGGTAVVLYSCKGSTVYEAWRNFTLVSPREGYVGHVRVLVIGEELARSGISETLDALKRSREMRTDYYVMVAKNAKASEVLSVLTPLEKIPANSLFSSVSTSDKITAATITIKMDELMDNLVTEGQQAVLTGVEIDGKPGGGDMKNIQNTRPGTKLRFDNIAVFRKDRLVGWLNRLESIGFSYATDRVHANSGAVLGDDRKKIVVEALATHTKRKARMINGKPHIYLQVSLIANIEDVQSGMDITTPAAIAELEQECERRVVRLMETSVEGLIDKYRSDALGFGNLIYKADPKAWRKLRKGPATSYLKNTEVHYTADVLINRIGVTGNSVIHDVKE